MGWGATLVVQWGKTHLPVQDNVGSIPGLGRSHMPRSNKAHVPQLLRLRSRARKPQLPSPRAVTTEARVPYSPSSTREATTREARTLRWESSPHSLRLEKSLHSIEDPAQPKTNKIMLKTVAALTTTTYQDSSDSTVISFADTLLFLYPSHVTKCFFHTLHPDLVFLHTIVQDKESELLGEMVDFPTEAGKIRQDEPRTTCDARNTF